MTFGEAKKQLLADDAARMKKWDEESAVRIAEGNADMLDLICTRKDRLWERIYWPTWRFARDIVKGHYWRALKNRYWRARQGYGYNDVWNLSYHFAETLPKMLRELKEVKHGVPFSIHMPGGYEVCYSIEEDNNPEYFASYEARWDDVVERMALGFEAHALLMEQGWRGDTEAERELSRIAKEGMQLFIDNFSSLND